MGDAEPAVTDAAGLAPLARVNTLTDFMQVPFPADERARADGAPSDGSLADLLTRRLYQTVFLADAAAVLSDALEDRVVFANLSPVVQHMMLTKMDALEAYALRHHYDTYMHARLVDDYAAVASRGAAAAGRASCDMDTLAVRMWDVRLRAVAVTRGLFRPAAAPAEAGGAGLPALYAARPPSASALLGGGGWRVAPARGPVREWSMGEVMDALHACETREYAVRWWESPEAELEWTGYLDALETRVAALALAPGTPATHNAPEAGWAHWETRAADAHGRARVVATATPAWVNVTCAPLRALRESHWVLSRLRAAYARVRATEAVVRATVAALPRWRAWLAERARLAGREETLWRRVRELVCRAHVTGSHAVTVARLAPDMTASSGDAHMRTVLEAPASGLAAGTGNLRSTTAWQRVLQEVMPESAGQYLYTEMLGSAEARAATSWTGTGWASDDRRVETALTLTTVDGLFSVSGRARVQWMDACVVLADTLTADLPAVEATGHPVLAQLCGGSLWVVIARDAGATPPAVAMRECGRGGLVEALAFWGALVMHACGGHLNGGRSDVRDVLAQFYPNVPSAAP